MYHHSKIIFLDIDGVLNRDLTTERFGGFKGIDKKLRDMFLSWWVARDFDVVLSSSWRIPSAHGDFLQHLRNNGLVWIGETPYLKGIGRGWEIKAYLENKLVEDYVILDDLGPSEFLKHQRSRLVQTSAHRGLEPKKLALIDKLMGYSDGAGNEGRSKASV